MNACAECGHLHFVSVHEGYAECPIDGCECEGQDWERGFPHDYVAAKRAAAAKREFEAYWAGSITAQLLPGRDKDSEKRSADRTTLVNLLYC